MADPLLNWMVRDGMRHRDALHALFSLMVAGPGLNGRWIDLIDDGAAVAVWLQPGQASSATGLFAQLALVPRFLAISGFGRIGRALAMGQMMDRLHPHKPHAYLQFLGCHPAHQGRGLGSALLAHRLAQVDAAGLPSYLETGTERNVALYLRHGYSVSNESRPTKNGPVCWPMWREAPDNR